MWLQESFKYAASVINNGRKPDEKFGQYAIWKCNNMYLSKAFRTFKPWSLIAKRIVHGFRHCALKLQCSYLTKLWHKAGVMSFSSWEELIKGLPKDLSWWDHTCLICIWMICLTLTLLNKFLILQMHNISCLWQWSKYFDHDIRT